MRRLAQRDRLAAIGRLASGISHDFNNMLQIMMMHVELATALTTPESAVRSHLETVHRQTVHAAEMIRRILDFARETPHEEGVVLLDEQLSDDIRLLRAVVPEAVQLELRVDGGPYPVLGDPTQLQQVITNLVVNASDAMPAGGSVVVEVAADDPVLAAAGDGGTSASASWVRVSVRDTGVGMEPATQARVFEPFFTTKDRGSGTGLGLAQVYGIVRQHGGEITVESEPGRGTCFFIRLPCCEPSQLPAAAVSTPGVPPHGRHRTVLVVEDDPAILEITSEGLRGLGYRVATARDGREALDVLEREAGIDLVLTDLTMPEVDGLMLARQIRTREDGPPIVLMSGYVPDVDSGERMALGIGRILYKPFTIAQLGEAVATALGEVA